MLCVLPFTFCSDTSSLCFYLLSSPILCQPPITLRSWGIWGEKAKVHGVRLASFLSALSLLHHQPGDLKGTATILFSISTAQNRLCSWTPKNVVFIFFTFLVEKIVIVFFSLFFVFFLFLCVWGLSAAFTCSKSWFNNSRHQNILWVNAVVACWGYSV